MGVHSSDRYRAGIIGLGYIGAADQVSGDALGQQVSSLDGTHAEALSRNPRVSLVVGSSRDPGRRARFEQRTGARTYAHWEEMLASEQLDIVSVATYAPAHAPMVAACARGGVRAIYCEKPLATRLEEAEAMLQACEEAAALLVVNHNRRFNPNYRRLQALIRDGGLGDLTSISLRWGTGRLGNVGTHLIDTLGMLAGRHVEAVSATLDPSHRPDCRGPQFQDPGGWGVLRLEGGLMATVDAADHGTGPPQLIVYGTEARAITGREDVTLEYWDGRREHWPSTRPEATSMDRAVAEILAWLDGARPFSYPAEEALRALETIVGFHASHARDAAWTRLPLTGADREREVWCA